MKKCKKKNIVLKIILNIFFWGTIFFFGTLTSIFLVQKGNNEVPSIAGYSVLSVLSDSMKSSGFSTGDIVVTKQTKVDNLNVGDTISFYVDYDDLNKKPALVSGYYNSSSLLKESNRSEHTVIFFHQIYRIEKDVEGKTWIRTKGSSNSSEDMFWTEEDSIIGKYVPELKGFSNFLSFCSTANGKIIFIGIPASLVFLYVIYKFLYYIYMSFLEQKVINGAIMLDDEICIKYNVGLNIQEKDKLKLITKCSEEKNQLILNSSGVLNIVNLIIKKKEQLLKLNHIILLRCLLS